MTNSNLWTVTTAFFLAQLIACASSSVPASGSSTTATEVCDGADNDADGTVDEQCPCTTGMTQSCFVGSPVARGTGGCDGVQSCERHGEFMQWGPCIGSSIPATDQNCDGQPDGVGSLPDAGLADGGSYYYSEAGWPTDATSGDSGIGYGDSGWYGGGADASSSCAGALGCDCLPGYICNGGLVCYAGVCANP